MGKRKSSRKPGSGKAKMMPLDKTFKCLFCQHTGTVSCKLDSKNKVGRLDCKDCGQSFSAEINRSFHPSLYCYAPTHLSSHLTDLTEAIDVYSEWIDACEDVNQNVADSPPPPPVNRKRANPVARPEYSDDEDKDLDRLTDSRKKSRKEQEEDAVRARQRQQEQDERDEEDLPELTSRKGTVVDDEEEEDDDEGAE